MLRYSDVQPGDRVLDAFCGGGTIVIEAAQVWDNIEVLGLDISSKSIDGARRNSEAAGVESRGNRYFGYPPIDLIQAAL